MRSPAKSSGETGAVRPTADKELKLANGHQVGLGPSPAKPEDAPADTHPGLERDAEAERPAKLCLDP